MRTNLSDPILLSSATLVKSGKPDSARTTVLRRFRKQQLANLLQQRRTENGGMQSDKAAHTQKVDTFESGCLLAFGIAALVAAFVLVGQSVARYTAATVVDLHILRAVGMTPRQTLIGYVDPERADGVLIQFVQDR